MTVHSQALRSKTNLRVLRGRTDRKKNRALIVSRTENALKPGEKELQEGRSLFSMQALIPAVAHPGSSFRALEDQQAKLGEMCCSQCVPWALGREISV